MHYKWTLYLTAKFVAFGVAFKISPRSVYQDQPRVYFYLHAYSDPKNAYYQHIPVALGEGLSDAGYYIRSNVDYWRSSLKQPFLFQRTTENPLKFDAIVVSYTMATKVPSEVIERHKSSKTPKMVMLDWGDGQQLVNEKLYDIYYRSSYSTAFMSAAPKKPLTISAFYLTKRIMEAADAAAVRAKAANIQKKQIYLVQHGPNKNPAHQVVDTMSKYLIDGLPPKMIKKWKQNTVNESNADYFYWAATGRRHNSHLYDLMKKSLLMDCTAGRWKGALIYRWESFELWEAFANGIAVIMPDLEEYGARLPVMPTKFVHYVPVVFKKKSLRLLRQNLSTGALNLEKIGKAGREWALLHYSPKSFAQRFIKDTFPAHARQLHR